MTLYYEFILLLLYFKCYAYKKYALLQLQEYNTFYNSNIKEQISMLCKYIYLCLFLCYGVYGCVCVCVSLT